MDELTGCIMSANHLRFVGRAFTRNVGAGVREAAQGTGIGWGLAVTESELPVVEVAMDEFE